MARPHDSADPKSGKPLASGAGVAGQVRQLVEDTAIMMGAGSAGVIHILMAILDRPAARETIAALGGDAEALRSAIMAEGWREKGDGMAPEVLEAAAPAATCGEAPYIRRLMFEAIRVAETVDALRPLLRQAGLAVPEEIAGVDERDAAGDNWSDFEDLLSDPFSPLGSEQPGPSAAGETADPGWVRAARAAPSADPARPAAPEARPAQPAKAATALKPEEEALAAVNAALRDLTALARDGALDQVVGRETDVAHVISVLRRRRKSSILLHGEAGVGKTAIAEAVAMALVAAGDVGPLGGRPLYEVSLTTLVAGSRFRGDFESRMVKLVERAKQDRAILFIDEIHMLIGSGSTTGRGMDGANILKPALARGEISVIGATTSQEMRALRQDAALMRRFDTLAVREPDAAQVLVILKRAGQAYFDFHGLDRQPGTLEEIVRIGESHQKARRFPDKAFDLLDMACVVAHEDRTGGGTVGPEHVRLAARRMGIRMPGLPDEATLGRLAALESRIVADRPERAPAARHVASVLRAEEILGSSRPPAIVVEGPEGSARGDFVRAAAKALDRPIHVVDAASLAGPGGAALLTGSRFGTGGIDGKLGILVEIAEADTCPVILFERAEAMPAEIQDLLAGVLADGTFRSGEGQLVDLSGATIFLSVVRETRSSPGFATTSQGRGADRRFSPELLALLPHRVELPEERNITRGAADREVSALRDAMNAAGIGLCVTPEAMAWVAEHAGRDGDAAVHRLVATGLRDALLERIVTRPETGAWEIGLEQGEPALRPALTLG
ncbi:AAA family ATPase [Cereibacter sphaeroides]|uniref:AAA family ATPase n=1 Tax=Cereibacter sphaeroides TaxID=1063 RepID=UPI001F3EBCF6|nr:AAA family ATPase [Cereibacter sphaeroides]MCE6959328.1 AAA family ATPase [Cereibacter sphaeroides]MCE6972920.1 AAA family ATPase [Cereibacter sphaeroides]